MKLIKFICTLCVLALPIILCSCSQRREITTDEINIVLAELEKKYDSDFTYIDGRVYASSTGFGISSPRINTVEINAYDVENPDIIIRATSDITRDNEYEYYGDDYARKYVSSKMKGLLSGSITEQWGSLWNMEGRLLFHDDIDDKSIVDSRIEDLLSLSYTLNIDLKLAVDKYRDIDREKEQEKVKVFLENASQLGVRDNNGFHFSAEYYSIDKFSILDFSSRSIISPYDAIFINKNSATSVDTQFNFTMIHRDSTNVLEENQALAYWLYELENVDGIGIISNWVIPTSVEINSESELNNFKKVVGNNTVLVSPRQLQDSSNPVLVVLDLDLYGVTLDEIKVYEFHSPHAEYGIKDITDELEHIEGNKYLLAYIESIAVVKVK